MSRRFSLVPCLFALACLVGGLNARPMSALMGALPVGAGLESIHDWSRSNAFVDLVKQSRKFGSTLVPWDGSAPVDANGWPTTDFGVLLIESTGSMQAHAGIYRVSGVCNSPPLIDIQANTSVTNLQWSPSTGQFNADVNFTGAGNNFVLTFRNTGGGIRNLRVLRPGHTPEQTFTTQFLSHLQRFSVLRFMDWTRTNASPVEHWSDRATPATAQYGIPTGVPWELCIELANTLNKPMWINIPHRATDDYVRQTARLFRDTLNPTIPIYVEYSNELWNSGFVQSIWHQERAIFETVNGIAPLNYDNSGNTWAWMHRRTAHRLAQIGAIFREEFGAAAAAARVRPVLAGQAVNTDTLRQGVDYTAAMLGRPSDHFYSLATAPYFLLGTLNNNPAMTLEQVLDALEASVADVATRTNFEHIAAMSRFNNLKMMMYEAGPNTYGGLGIPVKRLANFHPRMRTMCNDYLDQWAAWGFDTVMWFVGGATDWNTAWGTYGLTEDMAVQDTPKILAIDDTLASLRPDITGGWLVSENLDARLRTPRLTNWQNDPYLRWLNAGTALDYVVRPPAPGNYALSISAAGLLPNAQLRVEVNGQVITTITVPVASSGTNFQDTDPIDIHLPTGLSVVRLVVVTHRGYNISALRFFAEPCSGDTDGDRQVNFVDLNGVLNQFGRGGLGLPGDLDGDGDVDFADLSIVLAGFGANC